MFFFSDNVGKIRVFSIKVALATLCAGKLMDKLRCKYEFNFLSILTISKNILIYFRLILRKYSNYLIISNLPLSVRDRFGKIGERLV